MAGIRAGVAEPSTEALLVPIALATMHFAHGVGFIRGSARYGPPLPALASIAHLDHLTARSGAASA
jgi:hypothetical protein